MSIASLSTLPCPQFNLGSLIDIGQWLRQCLLYSAGERRRACVRVEAVQCVMCSVRVFLRAAAVPPPGCRVRRFPRGASALADDVQTDGEK